MKLLLVGDAHGFSGMISAAHLAVDIGADAIVALGDVWDVDLEIQIGERQIPFHVIPGNHERWDLWAKGKFGKGIIPHTDYMTFELGGKKFGVIGRIDDTPKVRDLMGQGLFLGDPFKIFFERLEGQKVRELLGGIDVLLTHDAPWPFILGHRPLPTTPYRGAGPIEHTEVTGSEYLNEVIRTLNPKLAFGAHMHQLCIRYIGQTRVIGLPPIDPGFQHRGYAILDTDTMRTEYVDL